MLKNEKRPGYKKTKVGWIPDEWECVPFASVFALTMVSLAPLPSVKYREIGVRSHGKGIFHKTPITGESLGDKRVFHCQPGALVFNIVFAWEQAVAVLSESERGFIASHRFPMFQGRKNQASEAYYLLFFKTRRGKEQLTIASPGGAGRNKTLGQADLEVLPVPHPPFSEQIAIAEVLACWDKAIQTLEDKIERKYQIKKGLALRLLSGQIRVPGFSKSWKIVSLGSICTIIMGQSPGSEFYNRNGKGLPLIQGNTDVCNRKSAPRIWTSCITKKCLPGDILMSVRAPVGEIAFSVHKACLGRGICAIRPNDVNPVFVYQTLLFMEEKWQSCSQGSTFTAVNSKDVSRFQVFIPLDASEQCAIAEILSATDAEIEALECKLALFKSQKRFLLNNLVTGTIRLPQFCKTARKGDHHE
jgi:type I restriction enzyme S subunit